MNDLTSPEPFPPVLPRRPRWGRSLFIGGCILFVLLLLPGWVAYRRFADEWDAQRAEAEADRVDPGWRFDELEGARSEVPYEENAAVVVLTSHKLLPRNWLPVPTPPNPGLIEEIPDLSPEIQLDDKQTQDLRAALQTAAPALAPARGLAQLPHGRYVVAWSADFLGTLLPHVQQVREVALLLTLDAALRVQEGDADGALASAQAALNAGRSLGDEPTAISQLVRRACVSLAVRSAERTLAQGEPSGPALAELQRQLEDEAAPSVLLIALRSERAAMHGALEAFKAGKVNYASFGMRMPALVPPAAMTILDAAKARAAQAAYLRYMTELVEIAKLPPQEQKARLQNLKKPEVNLPMLLVALGEGDNTKIVDIFRRQEALLHAAVAALAAERYRRDKGRWPEALTDLVPDYLPDVPTDPYDGGPLHCRRLDDGMVIYSFGPDGQDDGGKIVRRANPPKDADIGFRLWDVAHRRQPAPPPPPAPAEPPQP
jgi:hypothetical protein